MNSHRLNRHLPRKLALNGSEARGRALRHRGALPLSSPSASFLGRLWAADREGRSDPFT